MKRLISRAAVATVAVAAIAFTTGAASAATLPDPVAYNASGPQPGTIVLGQDGATQLHVTSWDARDGQSATGRAELCKRIRHHHWLWRCHRVIVHLPGVQRHPKPDGSTEQSFSHPFSHPSTASGGGGQTTSQFSWQPQR